MQALHFPHDEMRSDRRSGLRIREIAKKYGCSEVTAKKVCRGVVCPIPHQAHAAQRNVQRAIATWVAQGKARREARGQPDPKPRGQAGIPRWVAEAGLAQDYRDFKAAFNEHYAARECRRLKAEALQ